MIMPRHLLWVALAACDGADSGTDAGPIRNDAFDPRTPLTLAETGLCPDPGCAQIDPDMHAYEPRFALWSDAATKRRWISIPTGTTIDTSDMNHWNFPTGTKLWKEFTRDGVRVETRYMVKVLANSEAPDAWFFVSYRWNTSQDATTAITEGDSDANGTSHDIPSRRNCRECHARVTQRVLGFDAIQLDYAAPAGLLDLDDLVQGNLVAPPPPGVTPRFPLPGTSIDQAAFGYLHANCGNCHNPTSGDVVSNTLLELRLDTSKLGSVTDTPTYKTTVGVLPTARAAPGISVIVARQKPDESLLIYLMNAADPTEQMPPIATEDVDPEGQLALRAWINSL